jgi:ubiquinone biosynthesis accessory factor UbiJ
VLTGTVEQLLNRGLPRSPRARQLCAQLAGKSLAIEMPALVRVRISSNGLTLSVSRDALPAQASLSGGLLGLIALSGEHAQGALQRGGVKIEGDAQLTQQFQELLVLLRPDFEEELSLLIGDVSAHQLGRLARGAQQFGRRAAATTLTNLAEYFGHERADLVPRNEGEQFLRGVDTLRESVDRLEARLQLLSRRRGGV